MSQSASERVAWSDSSSGSRSARSRCLLAVACVGAILIGLTASAPKSQAAAVEGGIHSSDYFHKGLGHDVPLPSWAKKRAIHFLPMASESERQSLGQSALQPQEEPIEEGEEEEGEEGEEGLGIRCNRFGFCEEPPLLYNPAGAGVQHSPHLYAIFWGSNWSKEPGLAVRQQLLEMYEGLSGTEFQSIMSQYFDHTGRVGSSITLTTYEDNSVTAPSEVVNQESIRTEADAAIKVFEEKEKGWAPTLNDQFIILPAPGSTYGFRGFCAYHEYSPTHGTSISFVPYAGDKPFSKLTGCLSFDPEHDIGNITSMLASHEYAESATDPDPGDVHGAWRTAEEQEIADICASGDDELPNGTWVQGLWDNYQYNCSLADASPAWVYAQAQEVTGLKGHSATLHALIYPEQKPTEFHFEYGKEAEVYEASTPLPSGSVGAGSSVDSSEAVEEKITGLALSTPYHYRIVASNSTGTFHGADRVFTSPGPLATTNSADAISGYGATLHGTVNPRGEETSYYFEYDTTEYAAGEGSHGKVAPASPKALGSESKEIAISEPIKGLKPVTTYHFRVVARNAAGEKVYGKDQSFTTPGEWALASTELPAGTQTSLLPGSFCASTTVCTAVGSYRNAAGTRLTLAEARSGSNWQVQTTPNPSGTTEARLESVSCPSTTSCIAVGYAAVSSSPALTLAERWNGTTWSVLTTPNPSGSTEAHLESVSCTSSEACTAVGNSWNGTENKPLAERWNGSSWTVQSTPQGPHLKSYLHGVSCTGAEGCWAVGQSTVKKGESGSPTAIALHYNGKEWSLASISSAPANLLGVSCTSASFCLAVTGQGLGLLSYNGSSWSATQATQPPGTTGGALAAVACTSATACATVGSYPEGEGTAPLAEHFNGSEWTVQETTDPLRVIEGAETQGSFQSVSCATASACVATGYYNSAKTGSPFVEFHAP